MNPERLAQANPIWLPVSLPEAKHQVRLGEGVVVHDDELRSLIQLATSTVESDASVVFADGSFRWTLDGFPPGPIVLPVWNAYELTKLEYDDGAGNTVDLTSSVALSTSGPFPRVAMSDGNRWPGSGAGLDAVRVEYKAGFPDVESVPPELKRQVLSAIDSLWKNDPDTEDLGKAYRALQNRQVRTYL